MDRFSYLKAAITTPGVTGNKDWHISCFAIPILKSVSDWEADSYRYKIITGTDGLYYVDLDPDGKKVLVKISDYKVDTPLFTHQEVIEVDSSWCPTIPGKIQTTIGILIINTLILYPSLHGKLPYINNRIVFSDVIKVIADKTRNAGKITDKDISVPEMIDCIDRFSFLTCIASIVNIPTTPKVITPPPGIGKKRDELTKQYEGMLNDPTKVVELTNKLEAIDKEYLADDKAANIILTKKGKVARKKMFLIYGEANGFDKDEFNVVSAPLLKGIEADEKTLPKYFNDIRYGSYARGHITQMSGYSYKVLQRSLAGLTISGIPCDTTKGIKRLISKANYGSLANRYIKEGGWKLIDSIEDAAKYIGKVVEIRSAMYCTASGNGVCYKCMSENYKNSVSGITNLSAEISSVLMSLFLKLMHATATEATDLKLDDLVT